MLEIKNESGTFQVTSSQPVNNATNLVIRSVITGTFLKSQTPYTQASMCVVSYTTTGNAPLVAIRSAFPVAFYSSYKTGNTWYFKYLCPVANNDQTAIFYIFDEAPLTTLPITNIGLDVFGEDSNRIYNSGQIPIVITAFNEYNSEVYFPADRIYAVLPTIVDFSVNYSVNPPEVYITGSKINQGTITREGFSLGGNYLGYETTTQGTIYYSVIDVTGYN